MATDEPRHDPDDWTLPTTTGAHWTKDDEWIFLRLIEYANRRDISISQAQKDLLDMQLELEEVYDNHGKSFNATRHQIKFQTETIEAALTD